MRPGGTNAVTVSGCLAVATMQIPLGNEAQMMMCFFPTPPNVIVPILDRKSRSGQSCRPSFESCVVLRRVQRHPKETRAEDKRVGTSRTRRFCDLTEQRP